MINIPDNLNLDLYREEVLRYAISAYGFIVPFQERITCTQFADRIAQVYSLDNPVNREVVRVLHSIP